MECGGGFSFVGEMFLRFARSSNNRDLSPKGVKISLVRSDSDRQRLLHGWAGNKDEDKIPEGISHSE